jgi:predicted TIM-barrel fold metal-dependent hydrolase
MNTDSTKTLTRRDIVGSAMAMMAVGRAGLSHAATADEIIDIHAHIISQNKERYPAAPLGGQMSDFARDRPQTFEEYVAQADSAGVSKAAIVQVSTYYGIDNSYLADAIAKSPKRFIGVCSINTIAPDNVQVLDGWVRRGLSGLRIFLLPGDDDLLINPKAVPVWEYAAKKGITVCISTRGPGVSQVPVLLKRFPTVKVVFDHTDFLKLEEGPPYKGSQSFFDLAKFPNLYLKATPTTFRGAQVGSSTPQAFVKTLVSVFGADRIAFGSDLPSAAGPLTKIIAEVKDGMASLSPADRQMIFAGTAKRLYPALA